MYWLVVDGKYCAIRTRLSHGEKEANESFQHLIAKQLKLSPSEFRALVQCSLGANDYAALVTERGHVKG